MLLKQGARKIAIVLISAGMIGLVIGGDLVPWSNALAISVVGLFVWLAAVIELVKGKKGE